LTSGRLGNLHDTYQAVKQAASTTTAMRIARGVLSGIGTIVAVFTSTVGKLDDSAVRFVRTEGSPRQ
jgi:hypothetical protein